MAEAIAEVVTSYHSAKYCILVCQILSTVFLGSPGESKDKTFAEAIAEVVSEMSERTSATVEIQATEDETPVNMLCYDN